MSDVPNGLIGLSAYLDAFLKMLAAIGSPVVAYVLATQNRKRIKQEDDKHREEHTLELFRALSTPNPHFQQAAASVLVERLKRLKEDIEKRKPTEIDLSEQASIQYALHSVLKHDLDSEDQDSAPVARDSSSRLLTKYIGEQLIRLNQGQPLDAQGRPFDVNSEEGQKIYRARLKSPMHKESPLKRFDWQEVKIVQVWWPGVDARGVDFFRSDLRDCGMRFANLQDAVFYEARLCGTTLRAANLARANFQGSDLSSVDLRDADLTGAILSGVKSCAGVRLSGAVLRSAKLVGTDLLDADIGAADLTGADLTRARLAGVRNWDRAVWQGARYCSQTSFPVGFVPEHHHMELLAQAPA